jgi:ABC-2 type transport system ATP-binding protein
MAANNHRPRNVPSLNKGIDAVDETWAGRHASVLSQAASPRTALSAVVSIEGLTKTYPSGLQALKGVDLTIREGEIFALLGPNGAGKSTLINIVCGIVKPSGGRVSVAGHDIIGDWRAARATVGLVPQELTTDAFETVWAAVRFSRGLFGKAFDGPYLERVLRDLSLWDRKDSKIMTLSGGMKRRVMIAKALSHEPQVLFLDEPTAGVDVELRRDMWAMVRSLRARGVTVILTTHYIEEAEEMADRVGVINNGELIVVEDKATLMKKLGGKALTIRLATPLGAVPNTLAGWPVALSGDGQTLTYDYAAGAPHVSGLMRGLAEAGVDFADLDTSERSLEDIFVSLVRRSDA